MLAAQVEVQPAALSVARTDSLHSSASAEGTSSRCAICLVSTQRACCVDAHLVS